MNEQQRRLLGSDRMMPSFWNCGPFDGSMACGGGGDADSMVMDVQQQQQQTLPLPPQQRVRNLVDGFLSPFIACVQPNLQACMAPTTDWEPRQCYPMYSATSNSSSRGSRNRETTTTPGISASSAVVLSSAATGSSASPSTTITRTKPNDNDVLCGRGNNSTRHPGNQNFRDLIAANKAVYVTLTKKEKMLLARRIVDLVLNNTDPPARFLGRDSLTGIWYDIGMPRSLEKTSQALREKSAAARACGKLQVNSSSTEIKRVLSSDSAVSDVASGESKSMAADVGADEVKPATTMPRNRNGPVEAPPVTIPLHLQSVYGFKQPQQRLPEHLHLAPPPPNADPYASSSSHHHHYPPQVFQQTAFRPPAPSQNPPPPEMRQPFVAAEQVHRHYPHHDQYPNGEGHHHHLYYPPQQGSPPRQSRHPSYPIVTPQPPQYQDRNFERPPPLRNIVSTDSALPAFPMEEQVSSSAIAASSFTRERPTSNGKISPNREQEWKRQRLTDKTRRRFAVAVDDIANYNTDGVVVTKQLNTSNESGNSNASSTGLTKAIETQLTLEDRVIRSPSSMMQSSLSGRRWRNVDPPVRNGTTKEQRQQSSVLNSSADSSMDGLTALSTAAFLRLDESF